ncbi:MAG TPA: hypothetical protein VKA00_03990 [Trueperaceae bacterium]|nr:hypothetical protein [Trueperaceae bacterium]
MRERLPTIPTEALEGASRRLELRIIAGRVADCDIDLFVAIESELGRRIALQNALPEALDAVLDPRD